MSITCRMLNTNNICKNYQHRLPEYRFQEVSNCVVDSQLAVYLGLHGEVRIRLGIFHSSSVHSLTDVNNMQTAKHKQYLQKIFECFLKKCIKTEITAVTMDCQRGGCTAINVCVMLQVKRYIQIDRNKTREVYILLHVSDLTVNLPSVDVFVRLES